VKPKASYLKLNVDAAFNVDDFTGAAEAVIQMLMLLQRG
jgi:hypothetical protein